MDTTWLTVLGLTQTSLIFVGVSFFFATPPNGRKELFEIGLILLLSLVADASGIIGGLIYRVNMNLAYNIHGLLIIPLFLIFYRKKVQWRKVKLFLNILMAAFVAFGLANLFFIQEPLNFNSYTKTFGSVSMILVSLIYFYVLIRELPTESITKLPMFWINTAVLIYFSGTFFVNLSTDYLINVVKDNLIKPWTIHNFLGIVFYLIFSVGLWLNRSAFLSKSPTQAT